jgi:DNA-directed RNA polymerase II subunit RPB1
MALVWAHCKGKMICEADETKDDDGTGAPPTKIGHGGCGHIQPLIRKEGLKLFLVYKKGRADDDEVVCTSHVGQSEQSLLTDLCDL